MFDLDRIGSVSVGVLGDPAVDIYWYADMKKSELSRETPHYPLPVVREKMSLGAAGNVAANIAALQPARVSVCGVCGDDWRGQILRSLLAEAGIDSSGLAVEEGRFTQAYCKPMRMGISSVVYEDPRLDFAALDDPAPSSEEQVLRWLDRADESLDVLCVCDQFSHGTVTPAVIKRLSSMRIPVLVDSRTRIGSFAVRGVLKPNEDECRAALVSLGLPTPEDDREAAGLLAVHAGTDVFLTMGERGSLYVSPDGDGFCTPAILSDGKIDICGAGDSSLSAFACCLAAGASKAEAAEIAALASGVTIRKLGMTGTASREEIRALAEKQIRRQEETVS